MSELDLFDTPSGTAMTERMARLVAELKEEIQAIGDTDAQIDALNEIRLSIHEVSPLKDHPADCVVWERSEGIETQKINPNYQAPPEWQLLYESIKNDGYTMSVVAYRQPDGTIRVVDGFHRRLIERTFPDISQSTKGRIPLTLIRKTQESESDRMASTIRHNRARGTHNVELMSTIVSELVEMGKGDRWIQQHLGMSADELLRLKQITGVAALFANRDFSDSWEADVEPVEFEQ